MAKRKTVKKKLTPREKQLVEEPAFYSALGQALAQWASVEHSLFELYCVAVQSHKSNYAALSASYHVVSGFRTRLEMVDYALKFFLKKDSDISKWKSLKDRARKKSRKRNHLAHFMVINHVFNDEKEESYYLSPSIVDGKAAIDCGDDEKYQYDTKKLEQLQPVFGKLAMDIKTFIRSLKPEAQQ